MFVVSSEYLVHVNMFILGIPHVGFSYQKGLTVPQRFLLSGKICLQWRTKLERYGFDCLESNYEHHINFFIFNKNSFDLICGLTKIRIYQIC